MRTKKLSTFGIVVIGTGSVITFAMFFMGTGILWKLKLFEVPLILIMSAFLIASLTYEDAMKDLFDHLVIQRFGAFVALVMSVFMLVMKVLQNSF
jgi:hypothetical protein